MSDRKIFEYSLQDAWNRPIQSKQGEIFTAY